MVEQSTDAREVDGSSPFIPIKRDIIKGWHSLLCRTSNIAGLSLRLSNMAVEGGN